MNNLEEVKDISEHTKIANYFNPNFKTFFESLPGLHFVIDSNFKIISISSDLLSHEIFQNKIKENDNIVELIDELFQENKNLISKEFRQSILLLKGRDQISLPSKKITDSKQHVYFYKMVIKVSYHENESYFLISLIDTTAEKNTNEIIMNSLKEISDYKYAIDESSIVAITDNLGVINYVNEKFCQISKYASPELIGSNHKIINSGHHPKEFFEELYKTIQSGRIWEGEIKNKAKDGTFYWVQTTIVPFLDSNNKPLKYLAVRSDITERKLQEVELQKLNNQLNYAYQNITDSINYAKIIQQAILPGEKALSNIFPNSFVFYQPKDILSGDFYWFKQHGNSIYLGAIDCTGHGVPGALISMMGYNLLNETVNSKRKNTPSQVLHKLDNRVKKYLYKETNNLHDGLDIALCTINMESKMLQFSGANRPLIIVRNHEIFEFKANKKSITGEIDKNKKNIFEQHTFQLLKDDVVYLFTDGYVDQFSHLSNKKITTPRLREKLIEFSYLNKEKIKENIIQFFNDWKGDEDLTDDVLMMGIVI